MTNANAASNIGEEDIRTFQEKGATIVRRLIPAEWIDRLRAVFDEIKADATDLTDYYADDASALVSKPAMRSSLVRDDVWMHNEVMREFIFTSPIARAAATLMKSRTVRIYEDLLIYKEAGAQVSTPWHQDEPQWPLCGTQMASVWLSLEPVGCDTGALRFVTGSHRGPMYVPYVPSAMRDRVDADMHFFKGGALPAIDTDPARFPVESFDVQPGDGVIFHPRAIHAALGSASDRPRRTFSIRFIGDDVRWQPKSSVFHTWLRDINLLQGDPISGPRFPEIWSAEADATA